jgi:transposase
MIGLPAGTKVWLAAGTTDIRSGFNGLAAKVRTALGEDPFSGHVFVFRGRRRDLIKLLWWSGDGLCLLAQRLERDHFIWPQATNGSVALTQAQLSTLLEGTDWRRPDGLGSQSRPCKRHQRLVNLAHVQPSLPAQRHRRLKGLLLAQDEMVEGRREQLNTRAVEIEHFQAADRQIAAHAVRPQVGEARPPDRATGVAAGRLAGRRGRSGARDAGGRPRAAEKIGASAFARSFATATRRSMRQ